MISFIIPVYNKGFVLYRMLSSLMLNLSKAQIYDYEIIVINDGSTDNSLEEAIRFKKFNGNTEKIRIYYYRANIGKGFAIRYGFLKSKGDPVVFLDGDMDINTYQVIKALKYFYKDKPDMVIASKYLIRSKIYYPLNRYVYSKILKFIIKFLFNLTITDTQVGLKVFRRTVLKNILPKLMIKRFAFDLELLVVANMYKYNNIVEMPVVIKHKSVNKSSIGIKAVKNFCVDILAIFYRKNILHYYSQEKSEIPLGLPIIQTA